jgi:hypothetical protein
MPRLAASEEEAMSDGTGPLTPSKVSLRLTTAACILGLVGIFFSLLHFVMPNALTFALFMMLGQGSFGVGLLLYAVAVFRDLRRKKVL